MGINFRSSVVHFLVLKGQPVSTFWWWFCREFDNSLNVSDVVIFVMLSRSEFGQWLKKVTEHYLIEIILSSLKKWWDINMSQDSGACSCLSDCTGILHFSSFLPPKSFPSGGWWRTRSCNLNRHLPCAFRRALGATLTLMTNLSFKCNTVTLAKCVCFNAVFAEAMLCPLSSCA